MNQTVKQFKSGIIDQNPVLVLLLGICPALATSHSLITAAGMGITATAVLILTNFAISALRNLISEKIRLIVFTVIIATFVTAADYFLRAFAPELSASLGIFIPLITVSCIILARAEMFARKNGIIRSALDGLSVGLGFLGALILVAAIRELLSAGSLFEFNIIPDFIPRMSFMAEPVGGFFALGLVVAVMQFIRKKARAVV